MPSNSFVAHPIEPQWQIPNPSARITDEPMQCRASLTYGALMTVDWMGVPPGSRPMVAAIVEDRLKRMILGTLYPVELTTELHKIQDAIYLLRRDYWTPSYDSRELGDRLGRLTDSLTDPKSAVRK